MKKTRVFKGYRPTLSTDNKVLFTETNMEKDIGVYDFVTAELNKMIQYLADGNAGGPRIWRMVASHNGALIITGSTEGEIIAWNAEEGTRLQTFQVNLGDITGLFLIRNETHLISISRSYQINFWDISSGDCVATIQTVDTLTCGVINPTNSRLYIGSGDLGKPGSRGKNIKEWYLRDEEK